MSVLSVAGPPNGLTADCTEGLEQERQPLGHEKRVARCLRPPSHFSGVTCPPAPSGMTALPWEIRTWSSGAGSEMGPFSRRENGVQAPIGACGASQRRSHGLICPARAILLNSQCLHQPSSPAPGLFLACIFISQVGGLWPAQDTGFWATEPPTLSSAQCKVCPEL